ncbi:MAG: cryptochrome/photolyase family protein [Beijerinckiaceae bacterium]|nr:cryptochrome/photolyase family protein [Beijerinckiaceae bacterium]
MPNARCRHLILILGDQLDLQIACLRAGDPARDVVLMAEVMEEASYVRHHVKKIAFVFSAMRHFAAELEARGWRVEYRKLDDPANAGSLAGQAREAAERLRPQRIVVTHPGEWRVLEAMRGLEAKAGLALDILPDDRFIASIEEFADWAQGRKQFRMEYFYRDMRRKTRLLMDGDAPVGGAWNFDKENRKPAKPDLLAPQPLRIKPDAITRDVLALVRERFSDHFGDLEPFWFAVTRADALRALDLFVKEALPRFGDFQDAMLAGKPFLYHSVIAQYLNCGLLAPLEVCRRVEAAYLAGDAPLNAVEGYIRQIIGWREYVRGIYWLKMPGYAQQNALGAERPLPAFYWTGDTRMTCMREAIGQTKREAYAHHIQRLMVTGTFALIAGVSPHELHEWYLAVYADAYEWVELPNTLGMSQFADGGLLASKPYAASGAYIARMSDYCKGCAYDVKARTGEGACPFNALYWDFMSRHRGALSNNPRIAQIYRLYDGFAPAERAAIKASAARVLDNLDSL